MKYLSVCSGIEAATVAWHPLGWQAVAFGEIEKFPSQVLAHHYPDTPNWGDMTKFKEWPDADVNVFVGGTPCQSFSVAGLRKGLDDPRGNLMLTYLAIAARYRPQWLVWENVPGVLSSNGGLDFASLLRGMGELGYGFAYRILDAQYFGVAQRRRRVFVVGYLGNWRPAAAVLFERHSLSGHPAPSREKRQGVAAYAGRGIAECSPTIGCELAKQVNNQMIGNAEAFFIPAMHSELCPSLKARDVKGPSSDGDGDGDGAILVPMVQPIAFAQNQRDEVRIMAQAGALAAEPGMKQQTYIAQPIATHDVAGTMLSRNTSGGFSNSIDHAAAGYMALQPIALAENTIGRKPENGGNGDGFTEEGPMYTLNATGVHGVAQPIPFGVSEKPDVGHCLRSGASKADKHESTTYVAQPIPIDTMNMTLGHNSGGIGFGKPGDPSFTLTKGHSHAVAHSIGTDIYNGAITGDVAVPLTNRSDGTGTGPTVMQSMAVRRLTPIECERLQGFPDNYTDIKPKGKATPDGPRYKALGNSMAVPVMAWIGKRIQEVDAICQTQKQ